MQLTELKKHLIFPFASEPQITKAILKLSENFTINRDSLSDYLERPILVAAYTYFYLPTNAAKFEAVLEKLNLSVEYLNHYEIIDYGCGPGTFMYAALKKNIQSQLIGIEKSKLMREQAEKLLKVVSSSEQFKILKSIDELKDGEKKRLLIFGHSANEMELNEVISVIRKTGAEDILFVEPGTKEFFSKMKEIRSQLIESGYFANYPCPAQTQCPMTERDWCHQILKVNLPDDVKRLCQIVKKDRNYQPVSLFYFSRKADQQMVKNHRIVRVFEETKFSFEFLVCEKSQNKHQLIHLQVMKKNMTKAQIKDFRKIYAGDDINYHVEKILSNGIVRGKVE